MYDPLRAKARLLTYVSLAFLLGLGIASGLGWTAPGYAMPTISEAPQVSPEAVRPALDLSEAFINVSNVVTPAVVRIEVVRARGGGNGAQGVPEQFRRFFDIPEGQDLPPQRSGGSGFIISEDGYVLTNDHVVSGADEISVTTPDRRTYSAELIGADPTTDVAVIRILAPDEVFPTLSFGDSQELMVGEWILAVGNPGFGGSGTQLDYTVTAGIVSAKGRSLQLLSQELARNPDFRPADAGFAIEDFIQTDAVINPGNSGGPMVNLRGQVVGINSAIASQTGFYQGYGFAIPINLARRVMEDLIEYGAVRRPWMGIQMVNIQPEDAEYYGLPEVQGALIQDVTSGSPAEDAGVERADVIVALDGQPVTTSGNLQNRVAQLRPGDQITITVYRDKAPRDITIRLGQAPINQAPVEQPRVAETRTEEKLGIEVAPLDSELADRFNQPEAEGIVITDIRAGGPANRRGIFTGERILEVDGQPIESEADLQAALDAVEPGQVVSLLLMPPGGGSRIVNVRVPGS
jgi:serine protease Do